GDGLLDLVLGFAAGHRGSLSRGQLPPTLSRRWLATADTTSRYHDSGTLYPSRSHAVSTRAQAVGVRLRQARQDAGLTQAQLASVLGVTQAAVSNWEAGSRQPSID